MENEVSVECLWVLIHVVNALGVKVACAADNAMHNISFSEKKFSEIGSVLSGDARDECAFCFQGFSIFENWNELFKVNVLNI